jgi:hypothetical protein
VRPFEGLFASREAPTCLDEDLNPRSYDSEADALPIKFPRKSVVSFMMRISAALGSERDLA